ncbi:MAG: helix-turn-helix domain-containing protein [Bacteroidia bacterium]|nr:helix-turn-helix domain-containing protein [Bacteroidia bacterium]
MKKESPNQGLQGSKCNRTFSEEFKRKRAEEIVTRKASIRDICELYGVSRTSVYRWIYRYTEVEQGVKTVVQMESEAVKTAYYKARVSELERLYGQKQMELELISKVLELASEAAGYDLKKKYSPQLWNGSEATGISTAAQ